MPRSRIGGRRAGIAVISAAMLFVSVPAGSMAAYAAPVEGVSVSTADTGVPRALGGFDADFVIFVETGGTAATQVVTVTALTGMPASVTEAVTADGSCSIAAGPVVTCALGTLAPFTSATIVIRVSAGAVGVLTATTVVTTADADPDPADNTSVGTAEIIDLFGCTIIGTVGDDVIRGTAGADVICALGGDDRILARGGADAIYAGSGDDVADGGQGDDAVDPGSGNDTVRGGSGDDVIYGSDGDDRLYGDSGNDSVNGGNGDDVVDGGSGRDRVGTPDTAGGNDVADGGPGVDECITDFGDTRISCELPG